MTTSELEKFERAKVMARKLGYVVRKAEHLNDGKRYTLEHDGVVTDFATIDATLLQLAPRPRYQPPE